MLNGAYAQPLVACQRCSGVCSGRPSRYTGNNSRKPLLPSPGRCTRRIGAVMVGLPECAAAIAASRRAGSEAMSKPCAGVLDSTGWI
ncbi:hypothetical protein NB689_002108 [Xanthomonas sacchari]|nr:hypothetical protein [Xanthomonas sacchari]